MVADEDDHFDDLDMNTGWLETTELQPLKAFVEQKHAEVERNALFVLGISGNGTTHMLRLLAKQCAARYHVVHVAGDVFGRRPSKEKLHAAFKEAL